MVEKVSFKPGVKTAGCMDGNRGDSRRENVKPRGSTV